MTSTLALHKGGCHCHGVRFEFDCPKDGQEALTCNCSMCAMRNGNTHIFVPAEHFRLTAGEDLLTTYTFGKGIAQHKFCKICGILSFYIPRSNPDSRAITLGCIDPGTMGPVDVHFFDGQNWEKAAEELKARRAKKAAEEKAGDQKAQ